MAQDPSGKVNNDKIVFVPSSQEPQPLAYAAVPKRTHCPPQLFSLEDAFPSLEVAAKIKDKKRKHRDEKKKLHLVLSHPAEGMEVEQWIDAARKEQEGELLRQAAAEGQLDLVQRLMRHAGANPEAKDDEGWVALHHAAGKGQVHIAAFLLQEAGVAINPRNKGQGLTPLHLSIKHNFPDFAVFLIHHAVGAHHLNAAVVEALDVYKQSPLMYAAQAGLLEVVRCLVGECQVNVLSINAGGHSALSLAAEAGHVDIVAFFLHEVGLNPDVTYTSKGLSLLHIACIKGHLSLVKWLVVRGGASLTIASVESNNRVQHYAASCGHLAILQFLLVDAQLPVDVHGGPCMASPLHAAIVRGHLEVIIWLVEKAQSSMQIKDEAYRTVIEAALYYKQDAIYQYFIKRGAGGVISEGVKPIIPLPNRRLPVLDPGSIIKNEEENDNDDEKDKKLAPEVPPSPPPMTFASSSPSSSPYSTDSENEGMMNAENPKHQPHRRKKCHHQAQPPPPPPPPSPQPSPSRRPDPSPPSPQHHRSPSQPTALHSASGFTMPVPVHPSPSPFYYPPQPQHHIYHRPHPYHHHHQSSPATSPFRPSSNPMIVNPPSSTPIAGWGSLSASPRIPFLVTPPPPFPPSPLPSPAHLMMAAAAAAAAASANMIQQQQQQQLQQQQQQHKLSRKATKNKKRHMRLKKAKAYKALARLLEPQSTINFVGEEQETMDGEEAYSEEEEEEEKDGDMQSEGGRGGQGEGREGGGRDW